MGASARAERSRRRRGVRQSVYWSRCRLCQDPPEVVGRISTRGLCQACAEWMVREQARQVSRREGPLYDKWLRGRIRALEKEAGVTVVPNTVEHGSHGGRLRAVG